MNRALDTIRYNVSGPSLDTMDTNLTSRFGIIHTLACSAGVPCSVRRVHCEWLEGLQLPSRSYSKGMDGRLCTRVGAHGDRPGEVRGLGILRVYRAPSWRMSTAVYSSGPPGRLPRSTVYHL